jgi:hypothetical protein
MVGVRAKVLGRLGRSPLTPSKSVCSILPLARHLRAGDVFSWSTLARGTPLLSSPALGGPILQRALEALRLVAGGETMSTPGAPGTTPRPGVLRLIALGAPASILGSELSVYLAPALRFAPVQ